MRLLRFPVRPCGGNGAACLCGSAGWRNKSSERLLQGIRAVSYTHLDVYKRQIILCKLMRGCRGGGEDREAGRPAGGGTADHEDILKQKTDIQKTSVPSHPRFRGFQLIHVLKNFVYKLSHSVYSFCQAGYFSGRSVLMINTLCSRLVNLCNLSLIHIFFRDVFLWHPLHPVCDGVVGGVF